MCNTRGDLIHNPEQKEDTNIISDFETVYNKTIH